MYKVHVNVLNLFKIYKCDWKTNHRLDETLLQIIKETEDKDFKKFYFIMRLEKNNIFYFIYLNLNSFIFKRNVTTLISTRNTRKLCLALKIMRILLDEDRDAVIHLLQSEYTGNTLYNIFPKHYCVQ